MPNPSTKAQLAPWCDARLLYLRPFVRNMQNLPPRDEVDEVRQLDADCRRLAARFVPELALAPVPVTAGDIGVDCLVLYDNLLALREAARTKQPGHATGGRPRKWDDLWDLHNEMKAADPEVKDQNIVGAYRRRYPKREKATVKTLRDLRQRRQREQNH